MTTIIPLPRAEALAAPLRAVLYGRASRDRHKRGRSIKDQFRVGEIECEDRGWTIVDRYEDRDRSATRRATKVREEYERMVADAEAGRFDVIVYAERSRISRNLDHSLGLRNLCARTKILLCYDGRVFDMRKPADFKEFTRDAVQSEEEGESIIARNERTARLTAQRGGVWSGIPLGYRRQYDPDTGELVGQFPDPITGPIVRDLFKRAEGRQSLSSLVPLVLPYRPAATIATIRAILNNKSYIGIRQHHDQEYPAIWKGLIDEGTFWRVQAILEDPSRLTNHTSGIVHMLSGIGLCAVCRSERDFRSAPLKGRPPQPQHQRGSQYLCRRFHMTVMEKNLDAYVEEAILSWLGSDAARAAFQAQESAGVAEVERARAQAMTNQLEEARQQATQFNPATGLPLLSVASLAAMEQSLIPQIQAAESRARSQLSSGDALLDEVLGLGAGELDSFWDRLDLAQRRYLITKVLRVELRRAERRRSRYQDMDQRVGLIFFGEPGFAEWPDFPA